MGGKLPPGMATASATVPAWVLPELDALAAREGYGSRSQYLAALILEAVRREHARSPQAPDDRSIPGDKPPSEGDGP